MPFLLHERASLDLDNVPYLARSLTTNRDGWDRLVELASLARSLDPSLPQHLRFFKDTPNDEDPLSVPFVGVLTNVTASDLRADSLEDPTQTVLLNDALSRALPDHVVRSEMTAVMSGSEMNFANPIDAAVYTAFRDMQIELRTVVESDPMLSPKVRHLSSGTFRIPDLAFMNNADLARTAWLAPIPEGQAVSGLTRVRVAVQRMRELLGRPMAEVSEAERLELAPLIQGLNGRHDARSFEQRMEHGWIAFALAHGANDWVPTLLNLGADPTQAYSKVSPMALAIATNDAATLNALLVRRAVSPNQTFDGVPPMFDAATQRWIKGLDDVVMPAIVLATVMGANEAANVLLHHGADVDWTTDKGRFPLLVAAMGGDAAMVRTLVAHGANLSLEDAAHRLPEETIPQLDADDAQAPAMEALYEQLSGWRVDGTRPAVEPLPAAFTAPVTPVVNHGGNLDANVSTLDASARPPAEASPPVGLGESGEASPVVDHGTDGEVVVRTLRGSLTPGLTTVIPVTFEPLQEAPAESPTKLPSRAKLASRLDQQGSGDDAAAPVTPKAKAKKPRRTSGTGA